MSDTQIASGEYTNPEGRVGFSAEYGISPFNDAVGGGGGASDAWAASGGSGIPSGGYNPAYFETNYTPATSPTQGVDLTTVADMLTNLFGQSVFVPTSQPQSDVTVAPTAASSSSSILPILLMAGGIAAAYYFWKKKKGGE